jgi:colanic acid biosynthesis glycosyl transferase WcaI
MIHQHYHPEMSGTARRTKELAESFVKHGHIVSIVTSMPREYRSMPGVMEQKCFEKLNGVDVHRVKTLFEVKNNVIFRLLSYLSFVVLSLRYAYRLTGQSDIIVSIAPISSGIIGAFLRKVVGKHHHFDVPDILPDLGISAGMLKNKYIISALYKLERWVYDNSNTISTCTRGQTRNINGKGVALSKLRWIPDWIDNSFFVQHHARRMNDAKELISFPGKKLISFFGNIGALQNPKVFLDVMKSLEDDGRDEYLLLFIGDGIKLPELKRIARERNQENVLFLGRIERELVPSCMKRSDILVTNYVSDEHLDLYIPGKLFEYAISEKPIVMGARGDAKEFIEKFKLGMVVEPSHVIDMKNAILTVSNDAYEFTPQTAQFLKEYSLEKVTNLYSEVFKSLA